MTSERRVSIAPVWIGAAAGVFHPYVGVIIAAPSPGPYVLAVGQREATLGPTDSQCARLPFWPPMIRRLRGCLLLLSIQVQERYRLHCNPQTARRNRRRRAFCCGLS